MYPTPIPDGDVPEGFERVTYHPHARDVGEVASLQAIRGPVGQVVIRWSMSEEERDRLIAGAGVDLVLFLGPEGSLPPVGLNIEDTKIET